MKSSRRTFLKGVGAGGAGLASTHFVPIALAKDEKIAAAVEDRVATTCWIGKQDCNMYANRVDGRIVKFEGIPESPRNAGTLCAKGQAQIVGVYDPNRVKAPMMRTNEKGVAGKWKQVSWDEAMNQVASRIKKIREKDPELVLWQKGRSKSKALYDEPIKGALGCQTIGHGAYCSDAGYRAAEYTFGPSGVLMPDFKHTKYMLSWGWNLTNAGGNKLCYITFNRLFLEAKEKNAMKVVQIDPRLRGAGPFSDEWVSIKPATDMALALALCNRLIAQGTLDRPYLTKYTSAAFLVKKDGTFLRSGGKEQVWDSASNSAGAAGSASKPALEGEFDVGGEKVKPAFQIFKEQVAKYSPKWAAKVCGIEERQIVDIAKDLAKNASIGETVVIDGKTLPYRPVSVMSYHIAQQELGFQTMRSMMMLFMLMGAVGAVGGVRIDKKADKVDDKYEELDNVEIGEGPYGVMLKDSKFYPINSSCTGVMAKAMNDPKKYNVDEKKIPELVIIHYNNPVTSYPDQDEIKKAYGKFKYVASIGPWLNETADLFADVVLPASTIEKFEGPMDASDLYTDASALRTPGMDPLYDTRGEVDIYIDLCDRVGVLKGKGGYLDIVNEELKLTGEEQMADGKFALPLNKKPTSEEIFDRWALAKEAKGGIKYFEQKGVLVGDPYGPDVLYGAGTDPPYAGVLQRFYGESLLKYGKKMKELGAGKIFWQDYIPLPVWRQPTMDKSPSDYDLYLISYKQVENKQGRSSFFPLLKELMPKQHLAINPQTAKQKGIGDGDEVVVESHNAVTGKTKSLKTNARYSESIRPDTVGMPHHYGLWVHPETKGQGPSPNEIIPTGEGYVDATANQSFHVKVKVSKA